MNKILIAVPITCIFIYMIIGTVVAAVIPGAAVSEQTANLINRRLSCMKAVAAFKARHNLPVEDIDQEKKVMAGSVKLAETYGLDGESVRPFIQAQMNVAKAIQYRYRAQWLSDDTIPQEHSLELLRQEISDLNNAIFMSIATDLNAHASSSKYINFVYIERLKQQHVHHSDKFLLAVTMKVIRLYHPPRENVFEENAAVTHP